MFWTGRLTNPLDVIEQMTYLMFIRDLDDSDTFRCVRIETKGHIRTPDGLRHVCEGLNRDTEAIEKHFLEVLARFQATEKK